MNFENLSAPHINKLTAAITGNPAKRMANKEASEKRFVAAIKEAFGEGALEVAQEIQNAPGFETAQGIIVARLEQLEGEVLLYSLRAVEAEEVVAEEVAPAEAKPKAAKSRASKLDGLTFKVNGGKQADNPYREGTKSFAAFKLVQDNPGISFEEFKAQGGRVRTLQEDLRNSRIRSS